MAEKLQFVGNDLELVQKRTLRDVICDNIGLPSLQVNAFRVPSEDNPVLDCSEKNTLEPEELCLFGAPKPPLELTSPGYVTRVEGIKLLTRPKALFDARLIFYVILPQTIQS